MSAGDIIFLYYFAQVFIRTKLKKFIYYTNFWTALFCWRLKNRSFQMLITWIVHQMTPSICISRILSSKCLKLNHSAIKKKKASINDVSFILLLLIMKVITCLVLLVL